MIYFCKKKNVFKKKIEKMSGMSETPKYEHWQPPNIKKFAFS